MFLDGLLGCKKCPLSEHRTRVVPGYGNHDARMMIVSVAPAVREDQIGKPLAGETGQILAHHLSTMHVDMDRDCFRTNIVHCRPLKDREVLNVEARICRPYLDEEGETVDPIVILVIGAAAVKQMLPDEAGLLQIRGNVYKRHLWGKDRYIIPTVQPIFVQQNPQYWTPLFRQDLHKAVDIMRTGKYETNALPFRRTVATLDEIRRAVEAPIFGFDLETDTGNGADDSGDEIYDNDQGMRGAKVIGLGVCADPGDGLYYPFEDDAEAEAVMVMIQPQLESTEHLKIVSNAKFERHICHGYGIDLQNWDDTMLMAWVAGDYPLGLKDGFHLATGIEMQKIKTFYDRGFKRKDPRSGNYVVDMRAAQDADFPSVVAYAAQDADASLRLYYVLKHLLEERNQWDLYADLEVPVNDVVIEVERNGMLFDPNELTEAAANLRTGLEAVYARIMEVVDEFAPPADKKNKGVRFNPGSWQQVQNALYVWPTEHQIPTFRVTKNQKAMPTDKVSLAPYSANPLVRDILTYKAIQKMFGTYIEGLPKWMDNAGRIHSEVKQASVATGRFASANPNQTNIPARKRDDLSFEVDGSLIRNAFIAPMEPDNG
jgi:uracil-DNA glycosylase family 4